MPESSAGDLSRGEPGHVREAETSGTYLLNLVTDCSH
jgi:hypothetical protein